MSEDNSRPQQSETRARPKRRRGEAAAPLDHGPRERLRNGTAVLGYRADPERPQAPAIRAARAYVHYEHWHSQGILTDAEREAADRIAVAAELETGATCGDSGGLKGRAFWEAGGPTPRQVQASADLRQVRDLLGARDAMAVVGCVALGILEPIHIVKQGLAVMAEHWKMND